jgi:lactoylglutathione lyase
MQYKKLTSGDTVIEFHNSWTGEETVIINGQIISKKYSVMGTHHHFSLLENGEQVKYILTTKVNASMQVFLDLRRNGEVVHGDIPLPMGTKPKLPTNTEKKKGITNLKEYDLKEAITNFEKALEIDPKDPEIYFHMACAYSIMEDTVNGFEALKNAVANKLSDVESILNHDHLAYLRMHHAFEAFLNSNFTQYDETVLKKLHKKLAINPALTTFDEPVPHRRSGSHKKENPTIKIEHLAMYVHDLERMKSFYELYFGAKSGERYHNPTKQFTSYFLAFDAGCRLELMHKTSVPENANSNNKEYVGLIHFAISLGSKEKVDELTQQLRTDGYPVIGEPRTTGDGYYESVIADPEGNRIELTV